MAGWERNGQQAAVATWCNQGTKFSASLCPSRAGRPRPCPWGCSASPKKQPEGEEHIYQLILRILGNPYLTLEEDNEPKCKYNCKYNRKYNSKYNSKEWRRGILSMEDTTIHWHHCQGLSLGPYEGDCVFGYLLYIFVTCSKKRALY